VALKRDTRVTPIFWPTPVSPNLFVSYYLQIALLVYDVVFHAVPQILRDPSELGRLCPEDLVQTRPCCFRPCYTWSLRDWKDCILPRGSCGVGTQKRVVQCVQQG